MRLLDLFNSTNIKENLDSISQDTKIKQSMKEKDTNPEQEIDEVYPGQSSGRLKNFVKNKYGGRITCAKATKLQNDPNTSKFYKKRASWYKSLHCKGGKQVRESKSLTIFDIDNTLFRTFANVSVINKNGNTRQLTSEEFSTYKLQENEEFDFSEFKDAKFFNETSIPINEVWEIAQFILEDIKSLPNSKMCIVTARTDFDNKHLFLETFRKHGLDMSKVHVHRAGNLNTGIMANNKKLMIESLIEKNDYNEVRLFDDDENVLKEFLSLSKKFKNITFKAFPVSKTGTIGDSVIIDGK